VSAVAKADPASSNRIAAVTQLGYPVKMNTLVSEEPRLAASVATEGVKRPRVCLPTTRGFARNAFRCGMYEAEDVFAECADVDLLYLEPGKRFQLRSRLQWRLLYKDISRRLAYANPGLQPVQLSKDYDLFMLVCPIYSDPLYVMRFGGGRNDVGRASVGLTNCGRTRFRSINTGCLCCVSSIMLFSD